MWKWYQIYALGLYPAVDKRLGTIIAPAGQRQFELAHVSGTLLAGEVRGI